MILARSQPTSLLRNRIDSIVGNYISSGLFEGRRERGKANSQVLSARLIDTDRTLDCLIGPLLFTSTSSHLVQFIVIITITILRLPSSLSTWCIGHDATNNIAYLQFSSQGQTFVPRPGPQTTESFIVRKLRQFLGFTLRHAEDIFQTIGHVRDGHFGLIKRRAE